MSEKLPKFSRSHISATAAGELIEHAAAGAESGLPLDEIFLALAEDSENRQLRAAALQIAEELRRGVDMATALGAVKQGLPPYLRRALAASNDLGQTTAVLSGLVQHEATCRRLRRQMVSAMLYPTIVLGLLAAIVLGLVTLVMPQFQGIFADVDFTLPDLTVFLLRSASYLPGPLAAIVGVAFALVVVRFLPGGGRVVHWVRTGTPLLGRMWIWNAQHELASILAALTAQRVPVDEALACAAASLRDLNLARSVRIAAEKCAAGDTLSHSFAESIHIDPALPALAAWGEATDSLPAALTQAAKTFEEELDLQAAFLQRVMPSVLFIIIVTTIFFFVTGIMMPLVQMINNLATWAPAAPPPVNPMSLEGLVISSIALFTLGVSLRFALRLLYGARGPAQDDSVNLLMRILGWGLLVTPLVVLSIVGANWLSLIFFVAIAEALGELVLARRAAQRQAVWSLIGGALAGGRSLVDALRFHQARFSGLVGRWQRRLARDLEKGVEWPAAVWTNRRALPREAPAFAAIIGSGAVAERVAGDFDAFRDAAYQHAQRQASQRFIYLWTVALIMLGVLAYVMSRIVPSYQAIFEDFDLQLPRVTTAMISFANILVSVFTVPLIVLAVIAVPAALVVAALYLFDLPVLQWLSDRFTMFRHRAQVMRLLATALDSGKPVDVALRQLSTGQVSYPSRVVRRRLTEAHGRVVAGNEWLEALQSASLASATDAAVLRTAQSAGNLPWALRFLADRKVRLAIFRWSVLQQLAFVGVVLVFGAVIFWYAVAMLYPLADMVSILAGDV